MVKIHFGIRPSDDLGGLLVSRIYQNEHTYNFDIVLEESQTVQVVSIGYREAQEIGLINVQVLEKYFKNK
jgi:hypothetical protein